MAGKKQLFALGSATAVLFGVLGVPGAQAVGNAEDAPGIDVSNHNGTVDFEAVKADGQEFAFVLATDGTSFTSPEFDTQYQGAADAGLIRGAYHFARPGSGAAADQAQRFLETVGYSADGTSLPPVLDMEANPDGAACYGLSAGEMRDWIKAFLAEVKEQTERDGIIYTSPGFWKDCTGDTKEFSENPLWIADWGVDEPSSIGGWDAHTFWQYSDSGSVDGVNGPVDVNRFNGTVDELKALAAGSAARGSAAPGGDVATTAAITRDEVIDRAKKWSDDPVPYSMENYHDGYRTDCSGYVSMAWQLDTSLSTVTLPDVSHPIEKSELKKGDIIGNLGPGTGGAAGHVVIFEKWANDDRTEYWAYEQTPPETVHRKLTYPYPGKDDFAPHRFDDITD
ncbi:GH25 family lysozyme [Prauserella flavalba]|uniref:GH25 family lysozyme n=1 Tax=Prauserella flavalba TaxID=1477506 RepID=UPI0036E318C6